MKKSEIVKNILSEHSFNANPQGGEGFAPTNIALCKYWGKRDSELNLPVTASLSISLGDKGATTHIQEVSAATDQVFLNDQEISLSNAFGRRLSAFLDLFRPGPNVRYRVATRMNIPVAAGLASSACGFAALVVALDQLYAWELDRQSLSILARLGSGSASRSLWHGFVEWQVGLAANGMDSHGVLLNAQWPELQIGLHLLSTQQKPLSSREAMLRTVQTSQLYSAWPAQVEADMPALKAAILAKDFDRVGRVAEANALAMHATMMSSWPPVVYSQPETLAAMQQVWQLRAAGIPVYFTQDAGPNLKLLFLAETQAAVQAAFPNLQICIPFHN